MPSNWVKVRLSDVIGFQEGPGILAKDFRENGVPLVRLKGLDGREATLSGCNYVDAEKWRRKWRHFTLQPGDILASTSASFGRVALVGHEASGAIFYTGIIRFWPKDNRVTRKFIEYFLKSPEFVRQANQVASGSVIQHFGPTHLREMSIVLPPVEEQNRITGILSALDDKIQINQRISDTLTEISSAIFRDWFIDYGPVKRKLAGSTDPVDILGGVTQDRQLAASAADVIPDSFDSNGLPEGWYHKTLGEAVVQKKAPVKPQQHPARAFAHFSIPAYDDGAMPVRETGSSIKSNKHAVPNDSILFSRLNPHTPRIWWARTNPGVEAIASTEFMIAEPTLSFARPWIYCLFWSEPFLRSARARVSGTSNSHQRVSPTALMSVPILYPGDPAVEAFSRVTGPLLELVNANKKQEETLISMRDLLIPKLLSGAVAVDEAGEYMQEVA